MSYFFNNNIFDIFGCRDNVLNLYLPLTPATYNISVQTSTFNISDRNGDKKIQNVIPWTLKDGFVALTQILPKIYEEGLGFCQFIVRFPFPSQPNLFGGFTITRLGHFMSSTIPLMRRVKTKL